MLAPNPTRCLRYLAKQHSPRVGTRVHACPSAVEWTGRHHVSPLHRRPGTWRVWPSGPFRHKTSLRARWPSLMAFRAIATYSGPGTTVAAAAPRQQRGEAAAKVAQTHPPAQLTSINTQGQTALAHKPTFSRFFLFLPLSFGQLPIRKHHTSASCACGDPSDPKFGGWALPCRHHGTTGVFSVTGCYEN